MELCYLSANAVDFASIATTVEVGQLAIYYGIWKGIAGGEREISLMAEALEYERVGVG